MRDCVKMSRMRKAGRVIIAASLLAAATWTSAGAPGAHADQSVPAMAIGYQSGTITAVYEKTLDIDGRTYGLMPDVVIVDEEGNAMEPSSLMRNAAVKFHVKKEHSDKIDKMILIFPK